MEMQHRLIINKKKKVLVQKAESVLENSNMQNSKLENAQINGLLNIANSETCPEIIINYIRYQRGRLPEKWGYRNFADKLIEEINDLRNISRQIANNQSDKDTLYDIWIHLTRLMLGYLKRHFYYIKQKSISNKGRN